MSATFKLTGNTFPEGTTVKAYPASNWPTPGQPSGAPIGSSAAEGTVTSGSVTFTNLTADADYWAVAKVGSRYRYVGFMAGADLAESQDHLQIEDIGQAGEAGKALAADDPSVVKNAKAYGAKGDGATDDTVALQAALTAAAGGRLLIPAGRYKTTTGLKIPSDTVVEGEGDEISVIVGTWLMADGTATGSFHLRNAVTDGTAKNITVRNLGVEGAGTGAPSVNGVSPGPVSGLVFRRVRGVRVFNCRFYRVPCISVAYQGCSDVRIIGNEVIQSGRDGITGWWYTDPLKDVVVADNVIREVGDDGIAVWASESTNPNTSERPKRVSVTGNTIYGAKQAYSPQAGRGIVVAGLEDCSIVGNVISDTYAGAIHVSSDQYGSEFRARTLTITGNVVRRGGVYTDGSQPAHGITVQHADRVTVQANTIAECKAHGLYVTDANDCTFSGNAFYENGTGLGNYAIYLNGEAGLRNVTNCVVASNIVRNNTGGIRCNFTNRCPVNGNTCTDNGRTGNGTQNEGAGIYLTGDTVMMASNNSCFDTRGAGSKTQTFGIAVTGTGPALIIIGNYLTGNAGSGIGLAGVTPSWLVKRGNIESGTAASAVNYDQDPSGARQYSGTGTPESNVEAPVGSTFRRTDGGAATSFYVKESGTGKTGWVAK